MSRTTNARLAGFLASIAQHSMLMRLDAVLVLAVPLYTLTRNFDHDVAPLALSCRVTEGVTLVAEQPAGGAA
jgi:hypothetical protein